MDIGKSFTYQFEDKQWVSKLGLGALIAIVPILNFAWNGYMVGILRNVMNGAAEPLPTWDDLGKTFLDGLILFAVGLIYTLPVIVVFVVPMALIVLSGALSGDSNMQDIAEILGQTGGALSFCLMCVSVIYSLAFSVVYPAIQVVFAREGTFVSCFNFKEVFAIIGRHPGPFFTAWGMSLVTGFGVGLLVGLVNGTLGLIPCLGWIVGLVVTLGSVLYSSTLYAHLFGQFAREAYGAPLPISIP